MNKTVTLVIQIIVGAAMVIFGANKLFHFFPEPKPEDNTMGAQMKVLMDVLHSPYMYVIGALELLGRFGIINKKVCTSSPYVSYCLMLNAVLFHVFYDPKNFLFSLIFLILCLVLVYAHKDRFKSLLSA